MPLASFHYVFESHQALMTDLLNDRVREELAHDAQLSLRGDTEFEALRNALTDALDTLAQGPGDQAAAEDSR